MRSTDPVRSLCFGRALLSSGAALVLLVAAGPAETEQRPYTPKIEAASEEGRQAMATFRVPAALKVELFAAEPLLANPVAFCVDERNRFYVAETFRLHHGVTDTRGHMNWLDDDLACRTVEDRVAMYKKYAGERFEAEYEREHDRIRLIEDRDGDGRADHATVFADGFHDAATGLGAGLLARKGRVYYTNIPDLWLLSDGDGDGRAEVRQRLHHGYGVHVGFLGHDLHGLRLGPDGRLYFSIGDRGLNVETGGRKIVAPDTGSVLRCDPDGTNLEIFATGLRNPQELAFDEFGNLFTVDNNSDAGDKARLVHLVEGGDSGWRIGYQFIEAPHSRGPWNAEMMWLPQRDDQAAFFLPPLANLTDGPSGLTYDPGVSLLPERYKGHFFICDFRGAANTSGVRSFSVRPRGASFELADPQEFVWGLEATDVDFGTDGALYISDWVSGWGLTGKGRLYKVFDPKKVNDPAVQEVQRLLAEGMDDRPLDELAKLLAHADMRIRQEAQFALAARALQDLSGKARRESPALATLVRAAQGGPRLARLHGIWGLGLVARKDQALFQELGRELTGLLSDPDPEVRAQSATILADSNGSFAGAILARLGDESPRVRLAAALALGRLGARSGLGPQVGPKEVLAAAARLLRENDDRDPYLRHAGVMALAGLKDAAALRAAADDDSAAVRMGVLLAWRRWESPEVARFLGDRDPRLVLEAARAINDVPIDGAMSKLAALPIRPGQPEPLLRRILNANIRLGQPKNAKVLAGLAASSEIPEPIRVEALEALADWAKPSGRDRVTGLWRPLGERPAAAAVAALKPVAASLLAEGPEAVRRASARSVGRLGMKEAGEALHRLATDAQASAETRIEALRALEALDDPHLVAVVRAAAQAPEARLRAEGLRLLARRSPEAAIPALESVLQRGSTAEKQGALATLGELPVAAADAVLSRWLDALLAGKVAPEIQLDLLEAAARRSSGEVKAKLARYEAMRSTEDPLAPYREALLGGDARRGRRIFREKAEVQCLRCHKIHGQGGEVGPDLTGIGGRKERTYILESIVAPNRQIAQGFETLVVAQTDGQVLAGVLKGEDSQSLKLMTPEGRLVVLPKADIEETKRGASAMPEDISKNLSKAELRDLVEFLARSR
ncbi:MAG: HEAT repeat domain-containing protein [Isosphaeraceae bacterium]|nr:HEAT repeat domain-containing protein [Isosphaeraceae bacterium]